MDARGVSKEGAGNTTFPRSRDNQKKDRLRQFLWELATAGWTLAVNGVQAHISVQPCLVASWVSATFLSGHILGAPNLMVAKSGSQDRKQGKHESCRCPWERRARQPMGTQSKFTIQRSNSYRCFFTANLNLKRKEHCEFFSRLGTTDRDLGELTLERILTLCWLLPVFPRLRLQTLEWVEGPSRSHPGH